MTEEEKLRHALDRQMVPDNLDDISRELDAYVQLEFTDIDRLRDSYDRTLKRRHDADQTF